MNTRDTLWDSDWRRNILTLIENRLVQYTWATIPDELLTVMTYGVVSDIFQMFDENAPYNVPWINQPGNAVPSAEVIHEWLLEFKEHLAPDPRPLALDIAERIHADYGVGH